MESKQTGTETEVLGVPGSAFGLHSTLFAPLLPAEPPTASPVVRILAYGRSEGEAARAPPSSTEHCCPADSACGEQSTRAIVLVRRGRLPAGSGDR